MLVWAVVCSVAAGCAKSPRKAGFPEVLTINEWEQNPDRIWIIRPIETVRGGAKGEQVTVYGLFACYRSDKPEAPACFLAETAGTKEALVWPDNAAKYRW